MSPEIKIWIANFLVLFHAVIVGVTVAGGIAIFTGRFKKFNKRDYFAIAFFVFSIAQLISLVFTGGCIFTEWERTLRMEANSGIEYSNTFLEEYLPFLPGWFIESVPILTLGAIIGAAIQIYFAIQRRNKTGKVTL